MKTSVTHHVIQKLMHLPKFIGRDFLIVNVPKWSLSKPTENEIVQTNFGFRIKINPVFDKNIENVIYERGVYEIGTVKVLQSFLSKNDVFVDAGANIGFLSLVAAAKIGNKGQVHSFEPVPSTFDILKKNKAINNFEQIKLHSFALGNKKESVSIYAESENRGGASIMNKHSTQGIEIQVERLDDIDAVQRIDVLKIDVEGYELEVLKGAENKIKKNRPKLIIEYSSERTNKGEEFELYNWLLKIGEYRIYKLLKGKEQISELVEVKSKIDLPVHDNIFCIPI